MILYVQPILFLETWEHVSFISNGWPSVFHSIWKQFLRSHIRRFKTGSNNFVYPEDKDSKFPSAADLKLDNFFLTVLNYTHASQRLFVTLPTNIFSIAMLFQFGKCTKSHSARYYS